MRLLTIFLCGLFLTATTSLAQTFPEPRGTTVNDYADLISPEAEARIVEELEDLASGGTEMTIVTLSSVKFYASDMDINDYATALFNEWGVGDADAGDGVLLLVFRDDRLLRVETGPAYDEDRQAAAQDVIGSVIIPEFQNGDYEAGIEKGVSALIPALTASAPATTSAEGDGGGNALWYIIGGIVAAIGAVIGLNKRAKAKLAATPCPNCDQTGTLSKESVTLTAATLEAPGEGERRTTCSACGHVDAEAYAIAQLKPDAKPEFSGGKSDGGGATGKW